MVKDSLRIWSHQPDRKHVLLELRGRVDEQGVQELRQRLDGHIAAGACHVLVDASHASGRGYPLRVVLRAVAAVLERRRGWLRTVGSGSLVAGFQASVDELFMFYRAATRTDPPVEKPESDIARR